MYTTLMRTTLCKFMHLCSMNISINTAPHNVIWLSWFVQLSSKGVALLAWSHSSLPIHLYVQLGDVHRHHGLTVQTLHSWKRLRYKESCQVCQEAADNRCRTSHSVWAWLGIWTSCQQYSSERAHICFSDCLQCICWPSRSALLYSPWDTKSYCTRSVDNLGEQNANFKGL